MPKPEPASTPPKSSILIEFEDQGSIQVPRITFPSGVGKITQGLVDRHINLIYREIGRAQVLQRTGREAAVESPE